VRSLRTDRHRGPLRRGGVLLCALLMAAASTRSAVAFAPPAPTDAEVARVVAEIAADPAMGAAHKIHKLQFTQSNAPTASGSPLRWLTSALRWLASASRLIFWVLVATLAAILAVMLLRALRAPRRREEGPTGAAPATHVGSVDIRPESLPADIGAKALSLWEAGEHRAALSLLYRGALSRLVHLHAVPIRDSSTEAECLALATARLTHERTDFVATLINCWIRAVYAERMPASSAMRNLCSGFGTLLDKAEPNWAGGPGK
jgi:hypothetical protein